MTETRKYVSREMRRHMKGRPFLTTAAADLSWISCQLTAVEASDGVCVCQRALVCHTSFMYYPDTTGTLWL